MTATTLAPSWQRVSEKTHGFMRSPVLAPRRPKSPEEKRRRRVTTVWLLIFLNVLGTPAGGIIPIPHRIAQVLTQACLPAAFLLALSINPRVRIRPNVFLALYSALAVTSLMMSVRFIGFGTTYRAFRLIGFVVVIWLLTPWFGDRGLTLLRAHRRVLTIIIGSVILGLLISPGKALQYGRLGGAIWPIPATQVAHYAAVLVGLTVILWMCGMVSRRSALLVILPGIAALIGTHTRTVLVAMAVAILVAGLSLFGGSRRVRRAFLGAILIVVFIGLPLSSLVTSWAARGQSSSEITQLTGRTKAWALVFSEPCAETNKLLGSGLSNGGVNNQPDGSLDGLPIDSSWILAYQDQGLVGDILDGAMFVLLLFTALLRPRGRTRALALFLIVYCLVASFTESGMGIASPYLLDLTVAASLVALPATLEIRAPWSVARPRGLTSLPCPGSPRLRQRSCCRARPCPASRPDCPSGPRFRPSSRAASARRPRSASRSGGPRPYGTAPSRRPGVWAGAWRTRGCPASPTSPSASISPAHWAQHSTAPLPWPT